MNKLEKAPYPWSGYYMIQYAGFQWEAVILDRNKMLMDILKKKTREDCQRAVANYYGY